MIFCDSILSDYLQKGSLGTVASFISANSPCPILFSAATRKKYSTPSVNFSQTSVSFLASTVSTDNQVVRLESRFSMIYLVISHPPSLLGGFHENTTDSLWTSVTFRSRGLDGLSEKKKKINM